ncbi:endoplasmic reticulum-Golgi intermediate compartment protein 1-like protein, partial [Dinothrombium tinctorium]
VSELFVESVDGGTDKILVNLNVTLPRLECGVLGLDIQDDMGRHEVGFVENTEKTPIEDGKGCLFVAKFYINKVPGNFHVSTHSADRQPEHIHMAHVINKLTFGDDVSNTGIEGGFNSLRGKDKSEAQAHESHEYHLKIVPTIYESSSGNRMYSYQYTSAYRNVIAFSHTGRIIPAIWFRYDLTPITVKYHHRRKPFYTFITMICAIIGGTFSVASIIDSLVFTASNIFKKFELGKLS